MPELSTDLLFLRDAYATSCSATVVEVATDEDVVRLALDRTAFYPTGGGQPHDPGELAWDGAVAGVVDVRKEGARCGTRLAGRRSPIVGTTVDGAIDWDRRHALMRTHTALHVLCGVIWNEWGRCR